ncbi:helix-turn-helix transcriptional regulator [Flexivirga sp. ID2601S]|uniref:Helix-turn-helix transcriptional regulator n=1 Tax=Flexivirga aerilata TaxID=1656889 RepID=A0A849ALP5_9MICO|nr:helix-turn-helix transcriptional regulator [Flexivirga aerilata]
MENAHHADDRSVEALVSAALGSDRRRLVVLDWTQPAAGADAAVSGHYDEVLATGTRVIRLASLDADDVVALAEQAGALLPVAEVFALLQFTGGQARAIDELLRQSDASEWGMPQRSLRAPVRVSRVVAATLGELPPDARALVEAVAILEEADRRQPARAVHAVQVSEVTDPVTALDAALRSGLLTSLDADDVWIRLCDNMSRRAVLDQIGPAGRAARHERAAQVADDRAAALRHQWHATSLPDDGLADRLVDHAAETAKSGEWAATADLLVLAARATADPDRAGGRLIAAVDAMVGAGDVPRATRHLAELESLRETPLRNAVLGYLAVVRGRPGEATNRLGRAWALVNERRHPDEAAQIAGRQVLHSLAGCRASELVTWADRVVELGAPSSPAAIEARAIRGLGAAVLDGPEGALAEYGRLSASVPHGAVAQRMSMATGWLRLAADQPERAREELESAVPTDFLGGSLRISLWARAWLARAQFTTGDWSTALHTATTGIGLAERSGMTLLLPLLEWTRVQVLTLRGDWAAAEESLRGRSAGREYPIMRVPTALARAAFHEAQADYAAVVRALGVLREEWADEWVSSPGFWPWADVYANALVVTGDLDGADAFLTPHERRAAAAGHASTGARLAYARGRLLGQRGELDAARAEFERSIELLSPLPYPYDRARVHFAYGQTLRRAGRRGAADTVFSTAREGFSALGATTYVERCDRELAAGGVHATRPADRRFDALTPQEEAVATLVADGRSNKEVAAELFLSVKTVQYHLTRVYAKLGVRSRSQLAARWQRDPD